MSIKDIKEKIKPLWLNGAVSSVSAIKANLDLKEDVFIVLSIILIGLAGFGLGKLSALEKGRESVQIKPAKVVTSAEGVVSFEPADSPAANLANIPKTASVPMSAAALVSSDSAKGMLVASKNGTKYHFPWCAGASQIADKNKIWFSSYEEAQKAGYTKASNCKGLN